MTKKVVYTVKEVAELFNVSTAAIYDAEREGKLKAIRRIGPMRFPAKEIEGMLNIRPDEPTEKERRLEKENRKLQEEVMNLRARLNRVVQTACGELYEELGR